MTLAAERLIERILHYGKHAVIVMPRLVEDYEQEDLIVALSDALKDGVLLDNREAVIEYLRNKGREDMVQAFGDMPEEEYLRLQAIAENMHKADELAAEGGDELSAALSAADSEVAYGDVEPPAMDMGNGGMALGVMDSGLEAEAAYSPGVM